MLDLFNSMINEGFIDEGIFCEIKECHDIKLEKIWKDSELIAPEKGNETIA